MLLAAPLPVHLARRAPLATRGGGIGGGKQLVDQLTAERFLRLDARSGRGLGGARGGGEGCEGGGEGEGGGGNNRVGGLIRAAPPSPRDEARPTTAPEQHAHRAARIAAAQAATAGQLVVAGAGGSEGRGEPPRRCATLPSYERFFFGSSCWVAGSVSAATSVLTDSPLPGSPRRSQEELALARHLGVGALPPPVRSPRPGPRASLAPLSGLSPAAGLQRPGAAQIHRGR